MEQVCIEPRVRVNGCRERHREMLAALREAEQPLD
jgi:hypothetical protein